MNAWGLCVVGLALVVGLLALLLWRSGQRERRWREAAHQLRQRLADVEAHPWQPAAFEHNPDPVLVVDTQGRLVAANCQAATLFGPPQPGEPLIFRVRHHTAAELLNEVVRKGQPATGQMTGEGGRIFRLYAWPWPLTKPPQGAILYLKDVTDLVQAVHGRRELAANLGHELRTPLTSLKILAETLAQGNFDEPTLVSQLVGRLRDEIEAMIALVEDMIALSTIESGRLPLRLEPTPLAHVVAERVERIRPLADRKQIALEQAVPSDIVLSLDRERFGQVLTNLLDNAVKFTPPGGRVRVWVERRDDHICLAVQDTGPGIPPEALPHIFERFYKWDRARTRTGRQSTGLGLAIARHLVVAHGGRIWAESAPGQGATFFVELPAALAP